MRLPRNSIIPRESHDSRRGIHGMDGVGRTEKKNEVENGNRNDGDIG